MTFVFLAAAILSEVAGTVSLRLASAGRRVWFAAMAICYLLSFVFLSLTLSRGLGIGVAYGIWAAAGVALTTLASRALFKEPLTKIVGLGIACIMAGVLMVELGGGH